MDGHQSLDERWLVLGRHPIVQVIEHASFWVYAPAEDPPERFFDSDVYLQEQVQAAGLQSVLSRNVDVHGVHRVGLLSQVHAVRTLSLGVFCEVRQRLFQHGCLLLVAWPVDQQESFGARDAFLCHLIASDLQVVQLLLLLIHRLVFEGVRKFGDDQV